MIAKIVNTYKSGGLVRRQQNGFKPIIAVSLWQFWILYDYLPRCSPLDSKHRQWTCVYCTDNSPSTTRLTVTGLVINCFGAWAELC